MRRATQAAIIVALAAWAGSGLNAQRPAPKRSTTTACQPPSPRAPWLVAQREMLHDSAKSWSNDSLRTALMTAAGISTSEPLVVQPGWQVADTNATTTAAADAIASLKALARQRGSIWPLRSVVGAAGVRAVALLAQRDTALLRSSLHRMMEAGLDEGIKTDIAIMEDRLRLQSARKQLYGTQLHDSTGTLVPFATEDPSHADLRREGAGLPPLAWSLCNARASMTHPKG